MTDDPPTPISRYDDEAITVRGRTLSTEVMGELDFGEAAYLALAGEPPTEAESAVFNAMLTSLLAHGLTSHAIVARLTFAAEPESAHGAVASGVLGIGSRSAGAVRGCAATLQRLATADDPDAALAELVDGAAVTEPFGVRGFAGIGHGVFDPVDPRAEVILETAEAAGVAGEHVQLLGDVREAFEDLTGAHLPVNVLGAIAAVGSDLGLSPVGAQGIAVLSRTAGLVAEVADEARAPMAGHLRDGISAVVDD